MVKSGDEISTDSPHRKPERSEFAGPVERSCLKGGFNERPKALPRTKKKKAKIRVGNGDFGQICRGEWWRPRGVPAGKVSLGVRGRGSQVRGVGKF